LDSFVPSRRFPCEWQIPEPAPGEQFDKGRVNVTVGIGDAEPQTLGNVPAASDCASAGGGWYYDNRDAPTRIHACPATCNALTSSTDIQVNVLVGCVTEVAILR
jgi:hypothetical protein